MVHFNFKLRENFQANSHENSSQHQGKNFSNCKILSSSCTVVQEYPNTPIVCHDVYLNPLTTLCGKYWLHSVQFCLFGILDRMPPYYRRLCISSTKFNVHFCPISFLKSRVILKCSELCMCCY